MINHWGINLSLSLFIPAIIGLLVVRSLEGSLTRHPFFLLALSWGIGLGLLSQWMLALGIMEAPYTRVTITVPIIAVVLALIVYTLTIKKNKPLTHTDLLSGTKTAESPLGSTWLNKCLITAGIFFIIYISGFIYWRSLTIPIESWDEVATSSFTAKVFFYDRTLHRLNLPHPSYPLHVPLLEFWIALNLGRWDNILVKAIFPLMITAYSIIHFCYLRYLSNKKCGLWGLCLLFSSNMVAYHSTIAYRDITMLYYNCTAIILILLWDRRKKDGLLILGALFSGITSFVKLEGTGYLFIHWALLASALLLDRQTFWKAKLLAFIKFVSMSSIFCLPFHIYKMSCDIAGMENRIPTVLSLDNFHRFLAAIVYIAKDLFWSGNWNLVWVLLLISLICHRKRIRQSRDITLLLIALFSFIIVYIFIFTFTPAAIDYPTTFTRITLHFYPLAVLLIILLNNQDPARMDADKKAATK